MGDRFGCDPALKIIPRVVRDGGKLRVVLPGDPRYATAEGHLEP